MKSVKENLANEIEEIGKFLEEAETELTPNNNIKHKTQLFLNIPKKQLFTIHNSNLILPTPSKNDLAKFTAFFQTQILLKQKAHK